MTETGWQAIGRIAKARRERLGLNQEDLAQYGGPKVATVGKFERAAQERFPLRTQHQMEKALGWRRTTIEQVVASIDEDGLSVEDWEYDLVEEDIPDLSLPDERPPGYLAFGQETGPEFERRMRALSTVLQLVPESHQEAAVRAAARAMLTAVATDEQIQLAEAISVELSGPSTRTDFALAADPGDDAAGESESYNET